MDRKMTKVTLVIACLTTLFFTAFLYKSEIKQVMAANHLLPEPETLTELYFENHTQLPQTIQPGNINSFSFTIHNLEYKTVTYPYLVYVKRGEQKVTIDQGQVTLDNDQYRTITEKFSALKNFRYLVVVDLTNRNQQIDFWME